MVTSLRFTTRDLESLPDPWDGTRYEIIDGELYVSKQPGLGHQDVAGELYARLRTWSLETRRGRPYFTPGLIFAEDQNVVPDVVWISRERLRSAVGDDDKLHAAPELVVEVLSPGAANEQRDREAKLKLYSRQGVDEYWIVDTIHRVIEVYRRQEPTTDLLRLSQALRAADRLESPLLPGFGVTVAELFEAIA